MEIPRRIQAIGVALSMLLLTVGAARAGAPPVAARDDATLRVQVQESTPALRLPHAPDTQSLDPLRDALNRAGVAPAAIARILGDGAAATRLRDLLAFLATRTGAAFRLEVRAATGPGDRVQVDVSLFRQAKVRSFLAEVPQVDTVRVPIAELRIVLETPPIATTPRTAVRPLPPRPRGEAMAVILPPRLAPSRPKDASCWAPLALADLEAIRAVIDPYVAEQWAHESAPDRLSDPNRPPGGAPPDLDAPPAREAERTAQVAGPYPSGTIDEDPAVDPRRVRITNSAPGRATPPQAPSNACVAQWGSDLDPPTLACAREVVEYQQWDRLGRGARGALVFLQMLPLPGIDALVAAQRNAVGDEAAWRGAWASRWLEIAASRFEAGDLDGIERSLAALSSDPEARRVLADGLRARFGQEARADLQPLIRWVYEENFTRLYPEAADRNGMPVLGRMPTRWWWATNWLSELRRRHVAPDAAVEDVRSRAPGDRERATLLDVLPSLAAHPRLGPVAAALQAKW